MEDWNEIATRIGALAVHVDGRRWNEVLGLFASQVEVDYSSLFGGEPQSLTREQLIGNWRQLVPGFTHTTHVIGAPAIVVSGTTAKACASVVAWHYIKDKALQGQDLWLVGGTYEIGLAKDGGTWSIDALTLARAWSSGNQDLPRTASERASKVVGAP